MLWVLDAFVAYVAMDQEPLWCQRVEQKLYQLQITSVINREVLSVISVIIYPVAITYNRYDPYLLMIHPLSGAPFVAAYTTATGRIPTNLSAGNSCQPLAVKASCG